MDTGTINKRPSVRIVDHDPLHRGETVTFSAVIADANDKLETLTVEWRVGDTKENAAAISCAGEKKDECQYTVPAGTKWSSLYLVVQVSDRYSASAEAFRPFNIENRAPKAEIKLTQPTDNPPNYPLETKFTFSGEGSEDFDPGDTDRLIFQWEVKLNNQTFSAPDCFNPSKPKLCTFTADQPGDYQVSLTVKDPSEASSSPASETLKVNTDSAPCINPSSTSKSIFPQSLTPTMFASDRNHFEVSAVADDVNPYPANPDKPGSTTGSFIWTYRKGTSGKWERSTYTTNRLDFGERKLSVSDQWQIRVEYQDRQGSLAKCGSDVVSCALDHECGDSDCKCAQWITWTVTFL